MEDRSLDQLSESKIRFEPVLVKNLLADESDESDEDPVPISENSGEDSSFDDIQPLPDECSDPDQKPDNEQPLSLSLKDRESKSKEEFTSDKEQLTILENDSNKKNRESIAPKSDSKLYLNSCLKDALHTGDTISNQCIIVESSTSEENSVYGKTKDRRSLPAKNFEVHNVAKLNSSSPQNQQSKERMYHCDPHDSKDAKYISRYSLSNDYINYKQSAANKLSINEPKYSLPSANSFPHSTSSNAGVSIHGPIDTPVKGPTTATRPNPCISHRNIFETPQNKVSANDYSKNPIQTPATIFSHWSKQHNMFQTPLQNHTHKSKDSKLTPASTTQCSKTESRYCGTESKNVRRPLSETMRSSTVQGGHLPKLQEISVENQAKSSIKNVSPINEVVVKSEPVEYDDNKIRELDCKENWKPNPEAAPPECPMENKSNYAGHYNNQSQQQQKQQNPRPSEVAKYEKNYAIVENQIAQQQSRHQSLYIPTNAHNNREREKDYKTIVVQNRRYMLLGTIGTGGSCEVVRAQDTVNSELRAIKCVDLSKMDKDSAQGCLQEICMLKKLQGSCIVKMYDFEIRNNLVFVVLEIGDTDLSRFLKSMLQEKSQLPLSMILYYWTEMLTAVKYIHENGVIHSDLKPANFLLVRGRLKLIDFGIASSMNSEMTSVVKSTTVGTLNYISPEALTDTTTAGPDSPGQKENKYKISYKSDVWSLGCILYSMVYNVTPFHHLRNQWMKITAITDPKHRISFNTKTNLGESIPLVLIDVMKKCLQHDPKARPTVAELLQVPYLQTTNSFTYSTPKVPSNILMKIKRAVTDQEWQVFIEALEKNRVD